MSIFGNLQTVTLVNRLVDDSGNKIEQEFMYDGWSVKIADTLVAPIGPARILIHQSMRKFDPSTNQPVYGLGCPELGIPTDPIKKSELGNELIDRSNLPGRVEARRLNNPIIRHDPMVMGNPGGRDGAFPGHYGER